MTILLIEDDDVDAEGIRRGFRKKKWPHPVIHVHDGIEALERLRLGIPGPLLILLDLNMPRMNGIEFLRELRRDPELRQAIVFVLSTSNDIKDRKAAYSFNIAGYLLKSRAGKGYSNVAEIIETYKRNVEFPPDQ